MIMMFLIAATTGLGSTSAVYAATATIVDTEHRIRPERLRPRGSRGAKLADKLHDVIVGVRRRPSPRPGPRSIHEPPICRVVVYELPTPHEVGPSRCLRCLQWF